MYSEERQQKEVIARITKFVSRYLTNQFKDKLKQNKVMDKKICDYCKHFCVGYGCEMPDDYFKKEMQGDAIARCEGFWFITKSLTDTTNTELIRQEIERRLLEDYNSGDTEIDEVAQGVCAALLYFIDSLPKESEKGLKWRTDKPTADVIVAKIKGGYHVLRYLNFDSVQPKETGYHDEEAHLITPDYIEEWANLEEDETVTDCHQLEKEIDRAIDDLEGVAEKDADGVLIAHLTLIEHLKDFARHFAKWGAEHLKK